MKNQNQDNFIIHTMNTGFSRAADSFSKLIGKNVKIKNVQSLIVRNTKTVSYISEEKGDLYILVTQLIGEVSGKSYLIFTTDEVAEVARALRPNHSVQDLEAFLLEIDNIISASVISDLSNALKVELYGDVPQIAKIHSQDLQSFIDSEVLPEEPTSMIFSNTSFLFDNHDHVHPQFVWKLSSKIFELVPPNHIAA